MWKIQKYRIARRLTQENLAEKVDLSVSYISEIENGKKRPSLKTLEKIAAALEVSLVSLMGEDDKKDAEKEISYVRDLKKLSDFMKDRI